MKQIFIILRCKRTFSFFRVGWSDSRNPQVETRNACWKEGCFFSLLDGHEVAYSASLPWCCHSNEANSHDKIVEEIDTFSEVGT